MDLGDCLREEQSILRISTLFSLACHVYHELRRTCSNSGSGVLIAMLKGNVSLLSSRINLVESRGKWEGIERGKHLQNRIYCALNSFRLWVEYPGGVTGVTRGSTPSNLDLGLNPSERPNVETRHRTRCLHAKCRSRRKKPESATKSSHGTADTPLPSRTRGKRLDEQQGWALSTALPFKGGSADPDNDFDMTVRVTAAVQWLCRSQQE